MLQVNTIREICSENPRSHEEDSPPSPARAAGLLTTMITESPLKNILLTYRSLFTAAPLVFPFPPLEVSVHISFTSSRSLGNHFQRNRMQKGQ